MVINIVALLFLAPVWFFAFWPLATPVTPANMNWFSSMLGGTINFALVFCAVKARYQYVDLLFR